MLEPITAEEFKHLRETEELSMFEAKDRLRRQKLVQAIESAASLADLKDVLLELVEPGRVEPSYRPPARLGLSPPCPA